ncbi:DUF2130 domain-containing protein [Spiroplasma endosymbiont of Agriotes lineatus]|uniref:DUF2130 domain-containing protein n=1 Tax=Spiroplasma endosymbiont of Agriotes lineatus TaxID=3077930 RepID=UPI0030CB2C74
MSFIIQCPHCHQEITEKYFEKSHQTISHLQQFFDHKRQEYVSKLELQLKDSFEKEKQNEIKSSLNEKTKEWSEQHNNELNKIKEAHQQILDSLKQQLNEANSNLKIQKETKNADIKAFILEQKSSIEKLKQEEINKLKDSYQMTITNLEKKLNSLEATLKTNDLVFKENLATKQLEITKNKQQEIDLLKDKISILETERKTKEANIKVILAEKEKEWSNLQQNKLDTLNKEYQKNINDLQEKNHQLDMLVKTNNAKVQELVAKKETEIINSKQEEINKLIDETTELKLKLEQGRNIRTGILGANLENDFAGKMPSFFPNDHFEKTTKTINGKKPDFRLGVLSDDEEDNKVVGNILFELKNQEKLDNKWEKKLAIELKEWNAKFGIIVWTYAKAPFSRSSKYRDIFIINTDLEVIALIVNILKFLIKKEFALSLQSSNNKNDQEFKERFNNWLQGEFSSLIGKAVQEFAKFDNNIQQIQNSNEKLKIVKENLQEILITKIEVSLRKLL